MRVTVRAGSSEASRQPVPKPFEVAAARQEGDPKSPMPSRPLRNEDDTDAVVSETPHLSLRYKLVG